MQRDGEDPAVLALSVANSLTPAFAGTSWRPTRPPYKPYTSALVLDGVQVGSVMVMWGGPAGVHVQGTSSAAVPVAGVLRELWPEHTVSRADVAWDVDERGSFERLYRKVYELARSGSDAGGRKVSTSTEGDWLDREAGRTFYAGGRSSRLRVRVYEKGHEQRAKDPGCGASLDWTRVEWQLRPSSDQKRWLATASPAEAVGLSPFGAAVAREVVGLGVPAVGAVLRFASQDPGYWMVRQYRRFVLELVALDPEDAHRRLVELLEQTEPKSSVTPDVTGAPVPPSFVGVP